MFGFIIITTAFKNIKGKLSNKDIICLVKIKINGNSMCVKSIIDTGNFLKDPISKSPVIVVEKNALKQVIPSYILENLNQIINGEDVELGEYISKVRLIPFSSLGKENGILLGVKAEEVIVETSEKTIMLENVIIGIYNGFLSKMGKYQALIGLEIIENGYEEEVEYEYIRNIKI